MDTQMIAKAGYLDLIFDGRNKAYGAYALRTDYPRRMRRAALVLFSLSALLVASVFFPEGRREVISPAKAPISETYEYHEYHIKEEKLVVPKGGGSTAKTEALASPKVVEDAKMDQKKSMVEQEALTKATIGTQQAEGDGTIASSSSAGSTGVDGLGDLGEVGHAENEVEKDYVVAEENPQFPGGEDALMRFLAKEIRYPGKARDAQKEGEVVARFLVAKDGSIESIVIKKGFGFGSEDEAIRVLERMPRWSPGKMNGRPVRCWIQLPIRFVLD